ncbi:MAG: DUF885 domain-containing protein [Chloroflexota bacterium]
MSDLSARADSFLAEYFALSPLDATEAGEHSHDGRWPDLTVAGRLARIAFVDRWEAELRSLDPAGLAPDDSVDRDLLLDQLAAIRFEVSELRQERWDPLAWVYLIGGGIFPLLVREFAPVAVRLGSVTARLEGLPAVVDAAIAELRGIPGRPVSRLHTEVALVGIAGLTELVDDAEALAADAASADPAVADVLPRLAVAAGRARAEIDHLRDHLESTVLPQSEGDGRLGPDLYAARLRHLLRAGVGPDEVHDRASEEFAAVRSEMLRIARGLWPLWVPDRPLPGPTDPGGDAAAAGGETTVGGAAAVERETVAAVLDAIAAEHPAADDLVGYCRDVLVGIEAFARERDLVGLVEEPLEIRWTPRFLRSLAGAMLDSPGPLERGLRSFYYLTPPADDWTPEQVESYLREQNDRLLRLVTIHEAVPGHYLQLAYANRCPSKVRAVFGSGLFAEGWAVYVTQVMMDAGYAAGDDALLLVHWKYYLRAVANALLDVGVHTRSMTEVEAMRLMVDGAFQEESEARRKWDRARLTAAQLSEYFIGSLELWDLEREVRQRLAIASGDPRGAAAVPPPHVVGGFGETPGFTYRPYLERLLAHGTPPTPVLRRLVLGDTPTTTGVPR